MNEPLPGPLNEFLQHPPARPDPAALRQALLLQTSAVVRRRRTARRAVIAVALAAAVLIAAIAGRLGWPRTQQVPVPPPVNPSPEAAAPHTPPPSPVNPEPATAVAMEWQAFDAPRAQQPALYVAAGDRYVEENRDLASAVRCYGQAVAAAPKVEIDPNDNWLVMALKMDEIERRKEK